MLPILFNVLGEPVYSYPLLVGVGWGLGFSKAKENWISAGLTLKIFYYLFFGTFFSAWLGAKVFFLLFSSEDKMALYAQTVNFWLGGGFVFYGGLVFSLLFMFVASLLLSGFRLKDMDLFIAPLFLAHAVGRTGCFLAGCCFGEQCPLDSLDRYPVQLMESFGLFLLFYAAQLLLSIGKRGTPLFLTYLWGYSTMRFALEFLRGDIIRGSHMGLSTSQWVSLSLFACGCLLFFSGRFGLFRSRRV